MLAGATRQAVQRAVQAQLIASSTAAGARVTIGRGDPTMAADLPTIDITIARHSDDVTVDGIGYASPTMRRTFTISLKVYATGASAELADDACGDLVEEAYEALLADLGWLSAAAGDAGTHYLGARTDYYTGASEAQAYTAAALVALTVAVEQVTYG